MDNSKYIAKIFKIYPALYAVHENLDDESKKKFIEKITIQFTIENHDTTTLSKSKKNSWESTFIIKK